MINMGINAAAPRAARVNISVVAGVSAGGYAILGRLSKSGMAVAKIVENRQAGGRAGGRAWCIFTSGKQIEKETRGGRA